MHMSRKPRWLNWFYVALFVYLLCAFGVGCGHNIYRENEITGFSLTIPMGNGDHIGLRVGASKQVTATVRGGASFETTSSNSGGLFSGAGGQSKITQFKSNVQLNEGNLTEVLCSTNVPESVKIMLASNLCVAASAPYFPGSVLQTKESTIHIGRAAILSNSVERIQSEPQGVDRIVDRVADIVGTNVVNDALNTTGSVVHDVTNPMEGTVSEVKETVQSVENTVTKSLSTLKDVMWRLVFVVIITVLIVSMIAIICSKRKKTHKKIIVDAGLDPEPTSVPTPIYPAVFPELPPVSRSEEKKPQPKDNKSVKLSWFRRAMCQVVNVVMMLGRLVGMIPPGVRKEIVEIIRNYWKQRKAEKLVKKKK